MSMTMTMIHCMCQKKELWMKTFKAPLTIQKTNSIDGETLYRNTS